MEKLIKVFKKLEEADFKILWEEATFVFDTNVLLDLYRLPQTSKNQLLQILQNEKIRNRIWLPFQVMIEVMNNTINVIGDQKNKFNSVIAAFESALTNLDEVYKKLDKEISNLQVKTRHSTIDVAPILNEELFKDPITKVKSFIKEIQDKNVAHPNAGDKDDLKASIIEIFQNKVGEPFKKEDLDSIYKEGEVRYKNNRPPGYNDKDKPGMYTYEDLELRRKFGDLLLWKEILQKCKTDSIKYLVLVTGDKKDDWYGKKRANDNRSSIQIIKRDLFCSSNNGAFPFISNSILSKVCAGIFTN